MNNILSKADLCALYPQVEMKSRSRLTPAVVALVGVVLLALAGYTHEAENVSTALLTLGVIVAAVGIVTLIRPARQIIYKATGEKVTRHFKAYPQEARQEVEQALKSGKFEALDSLAAKDSNAPIVTATYTTTSGSLRIGQMLHYIPYEYKPLTEVFVHEERE